MKRKLVVKIPQEDSGFIQSFGHHLDLTNYHSPRTTFHAQNNSTRKAKATTSLWEMLSYLDFGTTGERVSVKAGDLQRLTISVKKVKECVLFILVVG